MGKEAQGVAKGDQVWEGGRDSCFDTGTSVPVTKPGVAGVQGYVKLWDIPK